MVFRKQAGSTALPTIVRLDAYSADKLAALGTQEPVSKVDGKELLMEGLVYFAGRPMTIGTVREPKEGRVTVYTADLDPALARPAAAPKPLCELIGLKVKGSGSKWIQGSNFYSKFLIRVSRDSSHMAIFSPELRDPSTGAAHYAIAVVNDRLEVVWQGTIDVHAAARESWLSSALVDNAGIVHVAITSNGPDPNVKNATLRGLSIFSVDASGASEITVPLDGGMSFYRAHLVQLADGSPLFTGSYGASSNAIEGFICGRVAFRAGSLEMTKRYVIEGDGAPRSFDIVDVLPRSDGGYFVVSEVYRGIEYDTYTRSIYGDVLVLSMDGTGKEEWKSVFRNLSAFDNPGISGRRAVVFHDRLFVFMVDTDELKAKRKSGKAMERGDMSDPYNVYVAFDPRSGEAQTKAILKGEKGAEFIADDIEPIGPGSYFSLTLDGLMGGRYKPVMLDFSLDTAK
jgi:hypothetical protein